MNILLEGRQVKQGQHLPFSVIGPIGSHDIRIHRASVAGERESISKLPKMAKNLS